jgi:hypothetical protein
VGSGIAGQRSTAELFDGTSAFAATGSMAAPRSFHAAVLLGSGKVLVAGGRNNPSGEPLSLSSAEVFDGVSSFAATGGMAVPREGHTATLLGSGKVLVAGGMDQTTGYLSSAELFDGASFSVTGSMTAPRYQAAAALLGSGGVLVAGGADGTGGTSASSETFDGTSTFASPIAMTTGRYGHTATKLASGNVLVTGGLDATASALSTAELLYVPAGGACNGNAECISGICDDGVCCASACPGGAVCRSCTIGTGACATVTGKDDPDTCTGASTCSPSGSCLLKNGQVPDAAAPEAGAGQCVSGFAADGVCCNTACASACDLCAAVGDAGAGVCLPTPDGSAGSPSCGSGLFCDGTNVTCPGLGALGDQCAGDAGTPGTGACQPNLSCTDGVCCDSPSCPVGSSCNETLHRGTCIKKLGTVCATSVECGSGFCVDGVCCDSACDGQCQACDATGSVGKCNAVSGAPHGARTPCAPAPASSPCSAKICDGNDGTSCAGFVGSDVVCGQPTCANGTATSAGTCGKGACNGIKMTPCVTYACGATTCNTSCASDADCAQGNKCDQPTGKCVSGATCDGDHTTTSPNGTTVDCSPYTCESNGTCKSTCGSVHDCVTPNVCDQSGACIPPPATTGESGGCAVARAPSENDAPRAWGLALLLSIARRRRSRATRRS